MRILLTNDDGIRAPGIVALHEEVAKLGEVLTVAPLNVQSATSHGVTFDEPLFVREVEVHERMKGLAVDGRPADCTKLGVCTLWPQVMEGTPDLVISGMNGGANIGINVLYSGTVAAAVEAAFLGIPAIAVSLHIGTWTKTRFDVAARHARVAIEACLAHGPLASHDLLTINVPVTESEGETPPMRVVPMNLAPVRDVYERREAPRGDTYYWASGHGLDFVHTAEGSDVEALLERCITVTPLHFDLTKHDALALWRDRLEGDRG